MQRIKRPLFALSFAITGLTAQADFLHPQGGMCYPSGETLRPVRIAYNAAEVSNHVVRVAYVLPSNRVAQSGAVERIRWALTMAQDWYRDAMALYGYGPRTFTVETEADGITPRVHVVQSSRDDEYFRVNLWEHTINEASTNGLPVWSPGQVWLLISEAHTQSPGGEVTGGTALGASYGSGDDPGVAMIGGDALARFRPEFLTNQSAYAGMIIPEVGPYPLVGGVSYPSFEGTNLSSVSSAAIGAMMHELGHAFGLPHDFRNDDNFRGNLMGNGCRGIRGNFFPGRYAHEYATINPAMARVLATSRYFGSPAGDGTRPGLIVSATNVTLFPAEGFITIAFEATDDQQLAAAWLEWNYEIVADLPLSGTQTNIHIKTPYFSAGNNVYQLCVWDLSGNRRNIELRVFVPPQPPGSPAALRPKLAVKNMVGLPGHSIELNAAGSAPPGGGASYSYTFFVDGPTNLVLEGDGNPLQIATLETSGRYLARVVVRDSEGREYSSMPAGILIHQPVLYTGASSLRNLVAIEGYDVSNRVSAGMAAPPVRPKTASAAGPGRVKNPASTGIVLERPESWTNGASLEGWRSSKSEAFFTYDQDNRLSVVTQSLTLTFQAIPIEALPPPSSLNMVATTNSSGGRLTGNVQASGASHLVFDLYAEKTPSRIYLGLYRPDYYANGSFFLSDLSVTAGWNRIFLPLTATNFNLLDFFQGQEGFLPPYNDEFLATLENVSHLIVHIERADTNPGAPAESYAINHVRWTDAIIRLSAEGTNHTAGAVNNGSIAVTSTIDWTATAGASWINLIAATGSGNGVITYALAPNSDASARSATITISGAGQTQTFTITQAGGLSINHWLAWPSALGFDYELHSATSLSNGLEDATVILRTPGNGDVVELGLEFTQKEQFFRLKANIK